MKALPPMQFEDFEIGQRVFVERVFDQSDFDQFSKLSGDRNPLHSDPEYAKRANFPGAVVPLHLTLSPISALAGMGLPGEPSLLMGHTVRAIEPVYFDEKVTYSAVIQEIIPSSRCLELRVLGIRDSDVVLDATVYVKARQAEWDSVSELPIIANSDVRGVLITGASGAIGQSIARRFAAKGVHLTLVHRRPSDAFSETISLCEASGAKVDALVADLATEEGIATVSESIKASDDLDVVIHSASAPLDAPLSDLVTTNYSALKAMAEAALPGYLRKQAGEICFISSVAVDTHPAGVDAYIAAKAMAQNYVAGLHARYSEYRLRSSVLSLPAVKTAFSDTLRHEDELVLLPEQVAEAVEEFLAARYREYPAASVTANGLQFPATMNWAEPQMTVDAQTSGSPGVEPVNASRSDRTGDDVCRVVAEVLGIDVGSLQSDSGLGRTPKWDSLAQIRIVLELERRFDIRLSGAALTETQNLVDLIALVEKR